MRLSERAAGRVEWNDDIVVLDLERHGRRVGLAILPVDRGGRSGSGRGRHRGRGRRRRERGGGAGRRRDARGRERGDRCLLRGLRRSGGASCGGERRQRRAGGGRESERGRGAVGLRCRGHARQRITRGPRECQFHVSSRAGRDGRLRRRQGEERKGPISSGHLPSPRTARMNRVRQRQRSAGAMDRESSADGLLTA